MIYPENLEQKLGFDKIRQMLVDSCLCPVGIEYVENIKFQFDFNQLVKQLNELNEVKQILGYEDNFPLNDYADFRGYIKKIRVKGSFLDAGEAVILKKALFTIGSLKKFFKVRQEENKYPLVGEIALEVPYFPFVLEELDRIFDKDGIIRDNASPLLLDLRGKLANKSRQISKLAHSLLKKAISAGYTDPETTVAIRDGRPVIPVQSSFKRQFGGIVHDESATGKTSYIEPNELVELNNEIRELQNEEKREIIRILTNLSDDIRPYSEELILSNEFMGFIDFNRAKTLLARKLEANMCSVVDKPALKWYEAFHPLLYLAHKKVGKDVVKQSIELSETSRILLISGPNAGGKSVCLQMAGLNQYMLQCGLFPPVNPDSEMGIFNEIFLDIGDEQSIDNDLSTYSSHLTNMKNFVKKATERSLVLIDEFGTGTEPMLGGAIAEAVLDDLNSKKVFGVITTHYTNLKHFAAETPGIVNGAMLYDAHNMEPLFKLEVGKPGSSFAFEIAKKIGLPEHILQKATRLLGEDHVNFDKHLKDILRDKRYWENKRASVKKNEKQLEEVLNKYKSDLQDVQASKKQIIGQAKKEAEEIINQANKLIENTIRDIREAQAEKEKTKQIRTALEKGGKDLKDQLSETDTEIEKKIDQIKAREARREKRKQERAEETKIQKKIPEKPQKKILPQIGDTVRISGHQTLGEVVEINGTTYILAVGQMLMNQPLTKIELVSGNRKTTQPKATFNSNIQREVTTRKLKFKPEIDIRGHRADEAIQKVSELLDEAVITGNNQLRVLHGKGNGILRQMIREYLSTVNIVKSFHDEDVRFGGSGITIIEMDY